MLRVKNLLACFVLVLVTTGCAWQRIPDAPQYTETRPIPAKVGVVFADNRATSNYGPLVVKEWNNMKLFDSITYPYREGDKVDAVVKMDISGGWKGSGAGAGVVIGLTFGLASTVIGPSMTGTHNARASIQKSSNEIADYSVKVESTVEWGLGSNAGEVSTKAEALQTKRIAFELANKIREDEKSILSRLGK